MKGEPRNAPTSQGLPTAIVAPLPEELRGIRRRATDRRRFLRRGTACFETALLGGRRVVLGSTGDGRRAAASGLRALSEAQPVAKYLFIGVAGGLRRGLQVAQPIVAREVRDASGAVDPPDPAATEALLRIDGVRPGLVFTGERILSSSEDKLALGRRLEQHLDHPADEADEAIVIDLETAVYVRAVAGAPYAAIRAVSDPAEETLAIDFERFDDGWGHTRRWRVVLYALTHPWMIPKLRELERRVRRSAERLADVVVSFLEADA